MYQGSLDLFFPTVGTTIIHPGTEIAFYFDNWKIILKWGRSGSETPLWTRDILQYAGNALSSYFHHGEGESQHRHPFKATTRYSGQRSIWSLEVVEAFPTSYRFAARGFSMQGKRYLRDPLPANDCMDVFHMASQWARSFPLSDKIPDGTVETFVSNDISLRLRVDRATARTPVAIKYREMVMILGTYRSFVTQPGQAWTAAWISFGHPMKRTGYWELAQGYMEGLNGGQVNRTHQEETY